MIGSLLARHFRRTLALMLALGAALFSLELLIVTVARQIDRGPGLLALMEQLLPPAMREQLVEQAAFFTFGGMVGFSFQHPVILAATLSFVMVAATTPAGERETGLLDLILARPVPRWRYFVAVLLHVVVGAIGLPLVQLAGVAVGLAVVDAPGEIPWTRYAASAAGLTTLLLAIGGIALLFGSTASRRGAAVARAVGLVLALYWVDATADLWPPLHNVRWLSPFSYHAPISAAVTPYTPPVNPIVLLGVFGISSAAALLRFQRQDL